MQWWWWVLLLRWWLDNGRWSISSIQFRGRGREKERRGERKKYKIMICIATVYLHTTDAEEFWGILGLNIQSLTLFVFCIHFTLFSTKSSKKISTNPFFSISHETWDWHMTNYRHVLCLCLCLIQRSYAFTPMKMPHAHVTANCK